MSQKNNVFLVLCTVLPNTTAVISQSSRIIYQEKFFMLAIVVYSWQMREGLTAFARCVCRLDRLRLYHLCAPGHLI